MLSLPVRRLLSRLSALLFFACFVFVADAQSAGQAPAPKGDRVEAETQFKTGLSFLYGVGGKKNPEEAVRWFRIASEQGYAKAQGILGLCYHAGQGVTQDFAEAAKWLRQAAEQDDAIAQFSFGTLYANGQGVMKDPSEAVKWYRKAAEQGHAAAQTNLGAALQSGNGVEKDLAQASSWHRKAAEQGFALAQANLGQMLASGQGLTKDSSEAVKWYRKAADQGDATAQFLLGSALFLGEGTPQDYVESYKWINLAAAQGNPAAAEHRLTVSEKMTPAQIAEAQKLSALFNARHSTNTSATASANNVSTNNLADFSTGTAFFVSDDGYLVTNFHVVSGALRIEVRTRQGKFPAKLVKFDRANDLALLKIARGTELFRPLALGASRGVKLGESVFTIGFPNTAVQGMEPKFTDGKINGLFGMQDDPRHFQISVAVQPGNSGGALVDVRGNVVGIVTFRLDDLKTFRLTGSLPQNVNYAVKSAFVGAFLDAIPELAEKLKVPATTNSKYEEMVKEAQEATALVLVYP